MSRQKTEFKVVWATAAHRLEADRAILEKLGERDVQTFAVVGNAPADLKDTDTAAVVFLPPPGVAMGLEDEGEKVLQAVLAAGVPACAALRSDLTDRAAFERRKAHLVSLARAAVRPIAEAKRNGEILSRLDLMDVIEEFQTAETDPPLYPTGLANLDSVLDGGLREGVYVLQGAPGGGKTALALYLAGSILKGNPKARVLFHSLEMSRRQVAARVLARLSFDLAGEIKDEDESMKALTVEAFAKQYAPKERAWQTPSKLNEIAERGTFGERVQREALERLLSMASRFMVAYRGAWVGPGLPTVNRLADIGNIVAGNGPAPVVFVDYLQLITPDKDFQGERRDAVGYNSSMLEQMAHDLRTPVVVLSSMNRTAVKDAQSGREVRMGAAKESGDVDYNADAVLSLVDAFTGEGDNAVPLEFHDGAREGKVVEIQVAKNRTGPMTHKGNHPRLDWLPPWGVFEVSRGKADLAPLASRNPFARR